ncbi:DNA polymerase III subunit delta' [Dermabacteraceae bacterium P13101]
MSVWENVIGQRQAVHTLRQATRPGGAMAHAWLLTGPPASGRSVAATAFAATLVCETREGCGHCNACRTALAGTHPDVSLVRTDKLSLSKDEVRSLIQVAQRSPGTADWRVIVMEDADRMTEGTFNVLLKSIEEPPPHTVWVLCAPSPQDLAQTIRSRCRVVSLVTPPVEAVADLLVRRDGVEPSAAERAARAAQGHIGLARRYALHPQAWQRREAIVRIPFSVHTAGDAVLRAAQLVDDASLEAGETCDELDAREREDFLRSAGVEGGAIPPALRSQLKTLEDDQKKRRTRTVRDVIDRNLIDLYSVYRDISVTLFEGEVQLVNTQLADEVRAAAERESARNVVAKMEAVQTARERIAGNVPVLLALEALLARNAVS